MADKQALFVVGGWEGHQPVQCADRVAKELEAHGFASEIGGSLDVLEDPQRLSTFDVVVPCWTQGAIGDEQLRGLMDAIAGGTGLAGWHGGIGDAFRDSPPFQFMVGGQWAAHPGGHIDFTVSFSDRNHPITQGLEDFALESEQYFMHVDPTNHVLATTVVSGENFPWLRGCVMPVAWVRPWWAGRVFYASVGHNLADFDLPAVTGLIVRGVCWAARELDPAGADRTVSRDTAAEAVADAHW